MISYPVSICPKNWTVFYLFLFCCLLNFFPPFLKHIEQCFGTQRDWAFNFYWACTELLLFLFYFCNQLLVYSYPAHQTWLLSSLLVTGIDFKVSLSFLRIRISFITSNQRTLKSNHDLQCNDSTEHELSVQMQNVTPTL